MRAGSPILAVPRLQPDIVRFTRFIKGVSVCVGGLAWYSYNLCSILTIRAFHCRMAYELETTTGLFYLMYSLWMFGGRGFLKKMIENNESENKDAAAVDDDNESRLNEKESEDSFGQNRRSIKLMIEVPKRVNANTSP